MTTLLLIALGWLAAAAVIAAVWSWRANVRKRRELDEWLAGRPQPGCPCGCSER